MKTINVKAYNTKKITKELPVVTNDGQPTIIKAEKGINYEFFDQSIGRAPNHIITKRSGKDLHVSFERDGKETDLIIEGFYDNEDHALIGIAEDGQYYYYIPDTGEVSEYVTQLVEGKVEGQALGGEHLAAPWWVALPHGIGMPWWLGLGVLPVLFGGDDDSSTNTPEPQPIPSPTTAPVATNDTAAPTTAGTPVTVNVLGNDTDANNDIDPTTVQIVGSTDGKTLVVAGEGTWTVDPVTGNITFTPEASFKGDPTPISYTVKDSTGLVSNPATVTVDYPQDPPVATNDTAAPTTAGTPVTVNVLGNDTDANNDIDPTTVQIVGSTDGKTLVVAGEGTWTVDPVTGNITFTPEASFKGDPTPISYTVKDSTGLVSNPATVTVDYPQDPPVATNDTAAPTTAGTPVTVNVLGNDTDANNDIDPTTVQIVGSTDGKTLVVAGEGTWTVDPVTGNITFTPEASFKGDPTPISYTVKDSTGLVSNPATVTVDYPQDPPVATNDTAAPTTAGTPVTVNVLGNDTDANNDIDPTTVQIVGSTDGKTLVVAGEGTWTVDPVTGNITFTPEASFKGDPTPISYTVKDSTGLVSNPATVTVDYPQDPPVATNDTAAPTTAGTPVTVNVLGNDTDANNDIDPTTVQIVGSTDGKTLVVAGEGTWTVDPVTGNITFTPEASFKGDPTPISYTVKDSTGLVSNPATVTVDYPQDPPVATNDTAAPTTAGTPVTVNVLGNDTDANNDIDPTTVQIVGSTDGKTLVVAGEGTWTVDPVTGNITFTPEASFKGDPTPISYTVKDSTGLVSNPATVTVDYPQDPPVATNDTAAPTTAGTPVTVNVLGNDTDANNDIDPTTVQIVGSTDGKTLVVAGEGTWTVDPVTGNITFTPEASFKGDPTPISYTVKDSTGLVSNPATVTVDYPQDPPVATNDTAAPTTAGTPVTVNVLGNDTDANNDIDPTTVQIVGSTDGKTLVVAGEGTWTVDPVTGNITFTPEASFKGDPTPISYTVKDSTGLVSNPATVTVDYPQDPPVATNDTAAPTTAGTPVTVNVLGNDTDANNDIDPTTVQIVGSTDGKTLVVAGEGTWTVDPVTGNITFTPEASFKGDPTPISYTVKDSTGLVSNPATVTVDYPQDPPVATNDTAAPTTAGTPVTVNVLGNDTDANNDIDPTTVQIVGSTDGKTLVVAGEGTWTVDPVTGNITFTPEASFKGDPTPISYTVKDSTGLVSNPATVTVDYPQDPPVATNDTAAPTTAGTPVTVNVLGNDTDANNDIDPTTVQIVGSTDGKTLVVAGEGTWTVDPVTGNITFTPEASFKGDPTPISYTVKDSTGLVSNPATVTVDYPQDPPVATNDTAAPTTAGTPVTVNVLGNDTDANNDIDPTTVQIVGSTDGKTLVVAGEGTWTVDPVTGNITFTPEASFKGDPTPISYTVKDSTGLVSNPATVTVDYPQDPPVATNDTAAPTTAGTPVTVNVLGNDTDANNDIDPTTVQIVGSTDGKTLVVAGEGTWTVDPVTGNITFTPEASFKGDPTPISYTVKDSTGLVSNPATVTVDYPQDKPAAVADTRIGATGQPVTVNVLANDTDAQNDIDPTTVKLIDPATNTPATSVTIANQGTWSVDAVTGAVTFTPVSGFTGDPTPISYTVTDKTGLTSDPVSITLDYPQDKPTAVADTGTGATGQPVKVDVLANDSDVQNDIDPTTVKLIDPATNTPATSVTIANQGTWSVDAVTGAVTFTPVAGFTGDPTPINYTVTDKTGLTSQPVSITLDYPQDKPTAVADTGTGATGQPVKVDVLANDSDVQNDIDPTTVKLIDPATNTPATSVTIANQGTWSVDAVTGAVTFTPVAGFTGDPTPISYTVTDKTGLTSDPVSITLDYPQDKPTAVADTGTGATGQPVKVDVLANDSDVQNDIDPTTVKLIDPATNTPATSVTIANQGTWSVDAVTGAVTFTPVAGFTGDPTPISYTVTDKTGLTSDPVSITLDYPQDKPTAVADTGTGATGQPVKVDVLANDSDVQNDIDPSTVVLVGGTNGGKTLVVPNQGTWSVAADGKVTFTPVSGFTGDPTPISYTVADKTGLVSDPATITVDYPQNKPVATNDTQAGTSGQPVVINVLSNDTDAQNDIDPTTVKLIDPATNTPATSVTIANQGTWSVAADGKVTFTPVSGFTGDPTPISYTVADKTGLVSDPATITVDYPQNKPVATNDTQAGTSGQPVVINVLSNDTDAQNDIDPSTVVLVGGTNGGKTLVVPNQGTWSVAADGKVTFTPVSGFTGDPTPISYTVADKTGLVSDPATITVDYPQNKPVATNDTQAGTSGQPVVINVLSNDTDAQNDIDPSTVVLVGGTNGGKTLVVPNQGTWSVAADGKVTFTPVSGFTGDPTPISYTVADKTGLVSDPATITVDYPQNKPVATNDTQAGTSGQPVVINVLSNDTDAQNDIDPTTVKLIDPATNTPATSVTIANQGTWSVAADGKVTFTPVSGFTGDPTPISYTVADKTGLVSDPATITVDYPQNKPVATNDTQAGTSGQPVVINVLSNDTDAQNDIDPSTVVLVGGTNGGKTLVVPNQGTWSVAADGKVTFTPVSGFTGDPTPISYTVADKTGLVSDPATITVDYPQNKPVATNDTQAGTSGQPVVINVLSNDTDAQNDIDPSTVVLVGGTNGGKTLVVPNQGTWSVAADGKVTFTPVSGFTGDPTPISYTVADKTGLVSNQATISIDYPLLISITAPSLNQAVEGKVDSSLSFTVAQNDISNVATTVHVKPDASGTVAASDIASITYVNAAGATVTVNDIVGFFANGIDITIPAGKTTGAVFTITAKNDALTEGTETLNMALSSPTNASIDTAHQIANGSVVDNTIQGSSTLEAITSGKGFNGEYYGINDSKSTVDSTFITHTDDKAFPNLAHIANMETMINGRAGATVVGTSNAVATGVADVRFYATKIDYHVNNTSLGTNTNRTSGSYIGANDNLYQFLSYNGQTDAQSAVVEKMFGKTTDGGIRMTGVIYLEEGYYDFSVTSDDGFRLQLAGQTVIQFDDIRSPQTSNSLTTNPNGIYVKGGLVPVELLYWEQGVHGVLNFNYQKHGDPSSSKVLDLTTTFMSHDPNLVLNDLQDMVHSTTNPSDWSVRTGSVLNGVANTADHIVGSDGKDYIMGGVQDDILTGGLGADKFIYSTKLNNGKDTITDFTVGTDKIALSDVLSVNSATIDPVTKTWVPLDTTTVSLPSGITNVAWNDTSKTLSFDTTGGANNTIEFQGMTASYSDLNSFLQANAVI